MTDRELLKEARDVLELYLGPYVGNGTGKIDLQSLKDRIDSALADTGSTDAEQLVKKIRVQTYQESGRFSGYHKYDISHSDAAALIEQYGRRVPRAFRQDLIDYMLDEIAGRKSYADDGTEYKNIDDVFKRYGVKIEEEGK